MSQQEFTDRKAKILYIDDDNELVDIYSRFFETSDYIFKVAYNAERGYEVAKIFVPDIIISDVAMPGMSGLELCKKIRSDKEIEDVIFILVSGIDVEAEDIIDGLSAGADDYLVKPFMRDVLFAKIKSSLRVKKLKDELRYSENMLEIALNERDKNAEELKLMQETLTKEKDLLFNSLKQIALMTDKDKRNADELETLKSSLATIRTSLITLLGDLIESKPQFHRGHSTNVAKIATEIAGMMSLSEKEIEAIQTAAMLHELGRLSIPDSLSLKSYDEYTRSEKDLMMQHPVKADALLENFPEFTNIRKIIRHIHETIDGRGFPNSLSGNKIPIGSRIIAAVNTFDNIMFRGKKGTIEQAFEILDNDAGTRYDVTIVNCLRRYISRNPVDYDNKFIEMRLFEVRPGMKLAASLYTMKGAKLLPEDTILTEENIEKIAKYNKIELLEETVFIKE